MIRRAGLALAGLYFLIPLVASFIYTVTDGKTGELTWSSYTGIVTADGFGDALRRSMILAVLTVIGTFAVVLPALLAIHLRLPGLRPVIETLSLLPLAIPPIALVVGVRSTLGLGPDQLAGTPIGDFLVSIQDPELPWVLVIVYIVLALPFAYRSLDAGLRGGDIRTQVDAARGLGASWPTVVGRVVLPQLKSGLLGATFLTVALVLGEFTISSLLLFEPLPVWMYRVSSTDGRFSIAVSVASLVFIWVLLMIVSAFDRKKDTTA